MIGAEAILLVDSRASHGQADELIYELRKLSKLPIGWVINTHFHWDHTWGNSRFPNAVLWGHERCRTEMISNGETARQRVLEWMPQEHHGSINEVVITPPTETFATSTTIDIGGRTVELCYHGLGHTNSDITVRVPGADVVFCGDLVEEGAPPSFGDSYPLDWGSTLEAIDLDPVVVPGHGDLVDAGFVVTQRGEIEAIATAARIGYRDKAPVESLIDKGPYPPEPMRNALSRAYAQLAGRI